jgi:hypothetical protein
VIDKPPSYKSMPATLLGRLAVDSRHHGKQLGELLPLNGRPSRLFLPTRTLDRLFAR